MSFVDMYILVFLYYIFKYIEQNINVMKLNLKVQLLMNI